MLGLNTNLSSVGISAAKGVDLVVARDQLGATLPRGSGAESQAPATTTASTGSKTRVAATRELTADQQRKVEELKEIDRKVHEHEQAHIAAGGGVVTSGASYTYTYGPDGKPYATGGEVGIDTSKEEKPQENIDKGRLVQRAALAPQDPSPQDYRVASIGAQLETTGRSDLTREQELERAAQAREAQQDSGDASQLLQNTYATVAAGSANADRVSVYA